MGGFYHVIPDFSKGARGNSYTSCSSPTKWERKTGLSETRRAKEGEGISKEMGSGVKR
jgi:hypothetical protein